MEWQVPRERKVLSEENGTPLTAVQSSHRHRVRSVTTKPNGHTHTHTHSQKSQSNLMVGVKLHGLDVINFRLKSNGLVKSFN